MTPANEKTYLQKHCFPECFLGTHMGRKQNVSPRRKHFSENKCLHRLNLENEAHVTLEFRQHYCFLGLQMRKNFLQKQKL